MTGAITTTELDQRAFESGCGCSYCKNGQEHDVFANDPNPTIYENIVLSGGGGTVTPAEIGINNAEELLRGLEWGPGNGTAVTVTYSFPTTAPSYYTDLISANPPFITNIFEYEAFTANMQDAVRGILNDISSFANITFTEVSGTGDIIFGQHPFYLSGGAIDTQTIAYAYYPELSEEFSSELEGLSGDVWFNAGLNLQNEMAEGERGYYAALHEIGHALGLVHSFTAGLTGAENTEQFTVMAYDTTPWGSEYASSHMLYDIAAIQAIYGANTTFNTGDTNYLLDPTAAYTIWDAGGIDTFDSTSVSSDVIIHLEEGGYSSVGLNENIAIAYGTIIENASAGNGNDEVYGNSYDNILSGGMGNDSYFYSAGADTFKDSGGDDTLVLSNSISSTDVSFLRYITSIDNLTLSISGGDDLTIENQFLNGSTNQIETISFGTSSSELLSNIRITSFGSENIDTIDGVTIGGHPDDTIYGFGGGDIINGLDGNDTIYGGEDNDHLWGGIGGDALFGNNGDDILYGEDGNDYLFGDKDDSAASANYTGNDIIFGGDGEDWIEGNKGNDIISGGADTDIILGDEGNDVLYGDSGDDYLIGDIGNDTLNGGSGSDDLYGGAGADNFRFDVNALDGIDSIYDFSLSDGDTLSFDELVATYSNLDILLENIGANTNISVDIDGGADSFTQIATLLGINIADIYTDII